MRLRTFAAAAVAAVAAAVPAQADVKPGLEGRACVPGSDAGAAAARLYGPGTRVAGRSRVAGLETVLALEPFIAPGTRHRMIPLPGRFCDAEAGLNVAWKALGRQVGDGAALARTYARLAAAPYFDRTRVRSIRSAGRVHRIRTHARTNGVVADWVLVTDREGVRTAKWSAVRFGVPPLVGEIEGLTARVGAAERYLRAAGSVLTAKRGLPTGTGPRDAVRPLGLKYRGSDGFTFVISVGDTGVSPDPGVDTGVSGLDRLRDIRDMIGENYEEFLGWGFTAGWAPPVLHTPLGTAPLPTAKAGTGYVYVNGANSLYCQACVYIADDFQIHILSHFDKALPVLGFRYPGRSTRDAMSDVIGHEMFHNFQNRYVKPTSTERRTPGVYSEGTARMQETLHSYSRISHQPDSLVIGDHNNVLFEGNDCKSSFTLGGFDDIPGGFIGSTPYDDALAAGPFDTSLGQSYGACHFWMRFYGTYGARPFVKLVSEGAPAGATVAEGEERSDAEKVIRAVEHATGGPFLEAQGVWLRGLITGKHMSWGPVLEGTGPVLDWAPLMDRWTPSPLAVGESVTRTLANGGVMAVKVAGATRPTAGDGARLIVLRDSDAGATLSYPADGELVAAPGAGESVYVMAGRRAADAKETTLTLGAP